MENMSNCLEDYSDIFNLETKLRQVLAQLQFKSNALDKSREQLTESQNLVCKLQISLENEKRTTNKLQQELNNTVQVITQFDNEKIRGQSERARLEINYQTSKIERQHLLDQVKIMKTENVQLQQTIEILEANLSEKNIHNQSMENSVIELRNQLLHLQSIMSSNLEKLQKEQEYLRCSFKNVTDIYGKIENISKQVLTSCNQDKNELEEIKQKLAIAILAQTPINFSASKTPDTFMNQELREFSDKINNRKIDDKLDEICKNLQNINVVPSNVTQVTKQAEFNIEDFD
ncbi:uncharacterized protein LOC122853728 [Aphidius gifuensis]|uniref:uncharacterized protein LOC122853728 n=1 Tax=Aphidius gifuensis TaxID=684658 RepID=UPI001CDB759C|nr:uncharacterized protein LOC122853728 [Aphidius gifuensis]